MNNSDNILSNSGITAVSFEDDEDIVDAIDYEVQRVEACLAGNIEAYQQGFLSGWMQDTSRPDHNVPLTVYDGNRVVANGVANIFRVDLKQSGIGNGTYGFKVKLADIILDGNQHEVTVVETDTGVVLGAFQLTSEVLAYSSIVGIESGNICGSLSIDYPNEASGFDIEVLSDGEVCATGVCALQEDSGKYGFSVKLPMAQFDDCFHIYSVRLKWLVTRSELFQEKLPSIITPWKYLSNDITSGSISSLSKRSSYRYCSLQSHLRKSSSADYVNVIKAHDVVVQGYTDRKKFPKLNLPHTVTPKVSIVIPVHNKFELTYHCIASLILSYNETSFEVIVVDDLSSDLTTGIEQYIKNVRLVKNRTNLGFLLSSTAGAETATGEYIVFLNNDTEVTTGWLDSLCNVFDKFSDVGIAGSKLVYPTGKLQEAGGIVWGNGKPWNIGNGGNAEDPQFNYVRQVDYLSGAALMISKAVWSEVGGFSAEFIPAYYEDVDLAFKVRDKGYRTYYCPSSVVVHFEGMSNGRELDSGIKKFQSINAPTFRSKWRHRYGSNGTEGVDLREQMDRGVDFRVLMVDCTVPRPDQDAGGYAAVQEMTLMQELGCKVTFIPNNMAHMGAYTDALQKSGIECIYAPFYSNIGEFLQQHGKEFDLVYIIRYDVAEEIVHYIRQYSQAKIVLNNCDLHFLRELRAALAAKDKCLVDTLQTRDRELAVMRSVDAVLSYNEVEHSVIASHNLSVDNIFKCPWVLESKLSQVPFERRSGIAFLGGFNHTPNREAIEYFVATVMPLLRVRIPGIKLHVYGSRVTKEIENLACDDVVIEGYVKSLSTVFDNCRVFVAPLLSGAGIKGKVLESIAYGVPCVLSPIAAESTGLTHGTNTLIAKDSKQWVDQIQSLYEDSDQWSRMSISSHRLVETQYSFENAIVGMSALFTYLELDPAVYRTATFNR